MKTTKRTYEEELQEISKEQYIEDIREGKFDDMNCKDEYIVKNVNPSNDGEEDDLPF